MDAEKQTWTTSFTRKQLIILRSGIAEVRLRKHNEFGYPDVTDEELDYIWNRLSKYIGSANSAISRYK